ncbi:MAG: hypothetical protein BWY64_03825 [bacterium ADurb.Bin363]|nr:MAG: hypothetical protein BWY64_03825 [bacterium ADurb.Bin363]
MTLEEKNKKSLKNFKEWLMLKKAQVKPEIYFVKDEEIKEICSRTYVRTDSMRFTHQYRNSN